MIENQIEHITITAHRQNGDREVIEIYDPRRIEIHDSALGFDPHQRHAVRLDCGGSKVTRRTEHATGTPGYRPGGE